MIAKLTCLGILCASVVHAAPDPPATRVDAIVRPAVDRGILPSVAVGVFANGTTQVFGYGKPQPNVDTKPTGATRYEIGSISKVFTSLLLADLVQHKYVSLADPIAKFLPAAQKTPTFEGHAITLEHLSTHTSGLPRLPTNFHPKNVADPYADYGAAELLAFLGSYTLTRTPGASYEYSNLGGGLLGYLLGLAMKSDYATLLAQRITGPLAMKNTSLADADAAHSAQGYDENGVAVPAWHATALASAATIRSTVDDLLLFLKANLGVSATPLAASIAMSHIKRHAAMPGNDIALGWHIHADGSLWHNGGTAGFHSYLAFDEKKKIGIVVLAAGSNNLVDAIGDALLKVAGGGPADPPTLPAAEVKVDAKVLDTYVGVYELKPGFDLTVTHEQDHLFVQATGQPKFRLYAEAIDRFNLRVIPATLTFQKVANDVSVTLKQNGHELSGVRRTKGAPQ